jgi:hypothetical protein
MHRSDEIADSLHHRGLNHVIADEELAACEHGLADSGFGHDCSVKHLRIAATVSGACSDCNGRWRELLSPANG